MNILVNEIDDETKKKMHFVKMSVGKKKSTYDFASFEKKKLGAATPLPSLFPPSPLSSPTIPPTQQRKPTSNSPKHQRNENTKQKAANSR